MLRAIPNTMDNTNSIRKTTIRILAISIENPAMRRAPKTYATNAIMRNRIPRSSNDAKLRFPMNFFHISLGVIFIRFVNREVS